MGLPDSNKGVADNEYWSRKRASSVRLGWIVGAVVLALFLIAIWKYRPL